MDKIALDVYSALKDIETDNVIAIDKGGKILEVKYSPFMNVYPTHEWMQNTEFNLVPMVVKLVINSIITNTKSAIVFKMDTNTDLFKKIKVTLENMVDLLDIEYDMDFYDAHGEWDDYDLRITICPPDSYSPLCYIIDIVDNILDEDDKAMIVFSNPDFGKLDFLSGIAYTYKNWTGVMKDALDHNSRKINICKADEGLCFYQGSADDCAKKVIYGESINKDKEKNIYDLYISISK